MMAQEKKWEELTDFQKRLKPSRLNMMQADNSGKPLPADPKVLADRLAIINHVTAYSFLIDEGRWDEWFDLFSDDILFETTAPCFGTISVKGKEAFRKFVNVRFRGPGSEKNAIAHRHTMGNVHVAEQTENSAEVRTYLLISNAHPDGKFYVFTSGTYSWLFWIELTIGVILPIVLFSIKKVRLSRTATLVSALLVAAGIVMNRFNTSWFAVLPVEDTFYFPSWMEVAILVGVFSGVLLVYTIIAHYFPVFAETVPVKRKHPALEHPATPTAEEHAAVPGD
jgi:3-phenylpropionate/cinnamic acid dioxygenase small subunit